MARPLRIEFEGCFYHITSRGNEKKRIFRNTGDRRRFLSLFKDVNHSYSGVIYSYVLMDNHYHILMETMEANLSKIMHHINVSYTVYFNKKYRRVGHLFQGRYKALVVDKESYLLELSRYIHLNPVRAGIVKKPENYRWSSYQYYIGKNKVIPEWLNIEWLVERFGPDKSFAFQQYRRFIEEAITKDIKNPFENTFVNTILGSNDFVEKVRKISRDNVKKDYEIPATKSLICSYDIEDILKIVSEYFSINIGEIKRKKYRFLPRKVAIYLSRKNTSLSLKELANYFDVGYTAISESIRQIKKDKYVMNQIDKIEQNLMI